MQRADILLEVADVLDSTGSYHSDWFDSSGIDSVRVSLSMYSGSQSVIEQSSDGVTPIGGANVANGAYQLSARYFRLSINLGSSSSGTSFLGAVRAMFL